MLLLWNVNSNQAELRATTLSVWPWEQHNLVHVLSWRSLIWYCQAMIKSKWISFLLSFLLLTYCLVHVPQGGLSGWPARPSPKWTATRAAYNQAGYPVCADCRPLPRLGSVCLNSTQTFQSTWLPSIEHFFHRCIAGLYSAFAGWARFSLLLTLWRKEQDWVGIRLKSILKQGYSLAFTATDKTSFNTVSTRVPHAPFTMKVFVPFSLFLFPISIYLLFCTGLQDMGLSLTCTMECSSPKSVLITNGR